MRTWLPANLLEAQKSLNRKPTSWVRLRDNALRWSTFTTSANAYGYPATYHASGVPQCPRDIDGVGVTVCRAWLISASQIRVSYISNVNSPGSWGYPDVNTYSVSGVHRPSVSWNNVFYARDGNIMRAFGGTYGEEVFHSGAYDVAGNHVALARPLGSGAVYLALLRVNGDHKCIELRRAGAHNTCPHRIPVDDDFHPASLQFFDAERLGDHDDILIVNTRAHGCPMVVHYNTLSNTWSTPRKLMPQDVIGMNNFLRISHLTVIGDQSGRPVLWATGRVMRGGSTGSHGQSMDVALRSIDGVHWTFDRTAYLHSSEWSNKLLVTHSFPPGRVYYAHGGSVLEAVAPMTMGGDAADLRRDISDDIISWRLTQPEAGQAPDASTILATHGGDYDPHTETEPGRWLTRYNDLACYPGLWAYRYAGYGNDAVLLSVEGVDRIPQVYRSGDRTFEFASRNMAMRLLYDWSSDQAWQWLSQVKHYDPCTQMSHLYSVSSVQIKVEVPDDPDVDAMVDEIEIDEEKGILYFDSPNRAAVNFTTKPPEARDFLVKTRFMISDDDPTGTLDTGYRGSNLDVAVQQGALSIFAGYFRDAGQDFTPFAKPGYEPEALHTISVTHSDGTISWGWLGPLRGEDPNEVWVWKTASGEGGWNGTPVANKTPVSYFISRADELALMGTGIGVVGAAADQYNLVAAFPDLKRQFLYLLIRRGDEDENAWIVWKRAPFNTPTNKNELYEVSMRRMGETIYADMMYCAYSGDSIERKAGSGGPSIEAEWPLAEPMVPVVSEHFDQTGRGKVGIICHIAVPETKVMHVLPNEKVIARSLDNWPDPPYAGHFTDNHWRGFSVKDDWQWFVAGGESGPLLHIGDESLPVTKVTPSNWRSRYYFHLTSSVFSQDHGEYGGDGWRSRWFVAEGTGPRWTDAPGDYVHGFRYHGPGTYDPQGNPQSRWGKEGDPYDTGQDLNGWFVVYLDGPGTGITTEIARHSIPGDTDDPWKPWQHWEDRDSDWFYTRMNAEAWARTTGAQTSTWGGRACYFMCMPGFHVSRRGSPDTEVDPGSTHPRSTIARQHWSPRLTLYGVWAYDGNKDWNIGEVITDIATHAGVMDVETEHSVNWSGNLGSYWVRDKHNNYVVQRDFDITVEMGSSLANGDVLSFTSRCPGANVAPPAIYAGYGIGGNRPYVMVAQWLPNAQHLHMGTYWLPNNVRGRQVRLVAHDRFFTFYVDGYQCPTLDVGPTFGLDTDGWNDAGLEAGHIFINRSGSSTSATVTQPELWSWADAITMDEKQNAISGLQRAIRDRRIKFVGTCDQQGHPVLRAGFLALHYGSGNISTYKGWLGRVSDHVPGESGFPSGGRHVSVYDDGMARTDRIPTHVRVVGYEVVDYIDHNAAAKYGWVFQCVHCPDLEEREAYEEGARIVRDALSLSFARRMTAAAQMDWEPEDALEFTYQPFDGGPPASGHYIVNDVGLSFGRDEGFACVASLRRLY